jgi:hypothetical protein
MKRKFVIVRASEGDNSLDVHVDLTETEQTQADLEAQYRDEFRLNEDLEGRDRHMKVFIIEIPEGPLDPKKYYSWWFSNG